MNDILKTQEEIVRMLRTVYDPEIPINIYELGLIYGVEVEGDIAQITMTLTAPGCPAADFILEDVRMKVERVEGINRVDVTLTFDPPWSKEMMSEEALAELGFL